jgi:hypothetical protein
MGQYKVTLPDGGSNIILADQAFVEQHWPGQWELLPEAETPAPAPVRHITRLAFRNRFTLPEKTALELSAIVDPAAPMEVKQQQAMLRAYLKDVEAATFIDLDRPDTRAGVQMLESAGLLAAGRAAQVLDSPVQDAEAYRS